MREKKVTINDVARYVGVSKSTVSHALSGRRQISPSQVAKVHEAIRVLGYQPNFAAQVMNTRSTGLIGVVITDMNSSHNIKLIDELTKQLKLANYSLTLCLAGSERSAGFEALKRVSNGMFDAVINMLPQISAEEAEETAGNIPVMTYLRHTKSAIVLDYRAGVRQAMKYLFDLGHRKVGYISTCYRSYGNDDPCLSAFREFMSQQGCSSEGLAYLGDGELASGIRGAAELMKKEPTAIFACNDEVASGVLQWAHESGIEVPKQLSIIGYDNTPLARAVYPTLTSVELYVEKIAEHTVKALLQLIHKDYLYEIPPLTVTPQLVIRNSTGPAPAK